MKKAVSYIKGDKLIWGIVILLYIISILTVYSVKGGITYKHLIIILIGMALMYITHLIKYTYYARISQLAIIVVVPLLLITLFQVARNSASRWLDIGGITFQTSDFAKVVLIIYLARLLAKKQDNIKDLKTSFIPLLIPVILICGMIYPENLSTAGILFITSLLMFYIGRVNMRYIFILIGIAFVLGLFYIGVKTISHPKDNEEEVAVVKPGKSSGRPATWINRWGKFWNGDPDMSSQENIAKIAIAKGGIIGKMPGRSTQKEILYASERDYIFAIIVEEYGFLGGLFLMLCYLLILFRTIMIVRGSPGTFGAFLSIGLSLLLVLQAFIHMSVSVNLIPVTGQTLPLVSMGGTSMVFSSIALGIILSVSAEIEKEEALLKEAPVNSEQAEENIEKENEE
jgi:cell division protein FtsW